MKTTGSMRTRLVLLAVGIVALAAHGAQAESNEPPRPCGTHASQSATIDQGLQVQVDPATGTYSMPAPGVLPEPTTQRRAATAEDVVITPGTSPAGGFKVKLETESRLRQGQE